MGPRAVPAAGSPGHEEIPDTLSEEESATNLEIVYCKATNVDRRDRDSRTNRIACHKSCERNVLAGTVTGPRRLAKQSAST